MITNEWRKSSRSADNGACVWVRRQAGFIQLRADLDPHAIVPMTEQEFATFIEGVKAGEMDLPTEDHDK